MMRPMKKLLLTACLLAPLPGIAGSPVIEDARATLRGDVWQFDVTVDHADTGWDHYADAWEVRDTDGTVLGTRKLLHPHENERPFTRSLSGVAIPDDITAVEIFPHDSVHGWGEPFTLDLDR